MRAIIAIALGLWLSGCTLLQPYDNPVDRKVLYTVENSAIVVFAGLNAYKKSCELQVIPSNCRLVVENIQFYTRQIPPYLTQLRTFVKTNDQVNAVVVLNQVQQLLSLAKTAAALNGVEMK